jgi:hypothetical protein
MTNLPFAPPALGSVLSLTGLPGGNDKIHDRSPYGNHGTITGATWQRLASGLWCLSFDGSDDYVNLGNHGSLDLVNGATIALWFMLTANAPAAGAYLISKDEYSAPDNNAGYTMVVLNTSHIINVDFRNNLVSNLASTVAVQKDRWYNLVATFEPNTAFRLYLNGSLDAADTTNIPATQKTTTNNCNLGRLQRAPGNSYFPGRIAMVRLYNRPLSALEIQNRFHREKHLFGEW